MTDLASLTQTTIGGLQVQPVADQSSFLNLLVYGESGVGKSRLSGSASEIADMSPVLLIDFEGGTLSLKDIYPTVEVVRVKEFDELQSVYNDLHLGRHGYKTVVIDSLTELQKLSMAGIMREVVRKDSDRDPDVPGLREWGKSSEQIRRFVRAFRDLPTHTIFTALSKQDKDTRTGMTSTRPDLPGKLASQIAGFMDMVLYLYIRQVEGENQRLLLTTSTETTIAKDRSAKLPPVVENSTMSAVYKAISA